jgi:hypothetical protein
LQVLLQELVSIRTQDVEIDGRERERPEFGPGKPAVVGMPCTQVDNGSVRLPLICTLYPSDRGAFTASAAFPPPVGAAAAVPANATAAAPNVVAAATVKLNPFIVILLGNGVSSESC